MGKTAIPEEIKALSFEDALTELEEIVRSLESGDTKLDGAIAAYERGALLKQHCEEKLADAKERVEKIAVGPGGTVKAEPADIS